MEQFFHETIENWDDWGRVFQSIPAFSLLVREIYRRESLPWEPLQNLTPGTNAVFRVGNTVAKVFFPKESGLDPFPDFRNESAVCGWLTEKSIPTPRLLAQGKIRDKYEFYYIITEYSRGAEAGTWLQTAPPDRKIAFAQQLKVILCKLNIPADGLLAPVDLLKRAVENPRLSQLPAALAEDLQNRAKALDLSQRVLVHGDLTGENLLIDEQGAVTVIDCADACLAPAWYELGPIVFELFRCDPVLLKAFAGDNREAFVERTLDAVSLHDFGADLLREAARRAGIPLFSRLENVKEFLKRNIAQFELATRK